MEKFRTADGTMIVGRDIEDAVCRALHHDQLPLVPYMPDNVLEDFMAIVDNFGYKTRDVS